MATMDFESRNFKLRWLVGTKKGNDEAKTGFCIFCYISANLKAKTCLKPVFNREETLQFGG